MDQYHVLWKTPQKIIFDLGNLIDNTYTAAFNTTLTATFFTVPDTQPQADSILPISARLSSANTPSAFQLPQQNASVSYQIPQNVKRAVVSLSACGQSAEEFWYTNVFSSEQNTFADTTGTLYGYSPFREVQLLIDGQLAGVSWPFPIIFTGGIVPGFWRPIVGVDAFDLREHEIDITPWLPLLCDGVTHSFEIRVVGLDDDGMSHASLSQTVGSYWIVTGKIFLFLDKEGSVTTGTHPSIDTAPPQIAIASSISQNSTGANETLIYTTHVSRAFTITSTITTSDGPQPVTWTQTLSYTNYNALTAQGFTQFTSQNTTGTDSSKTSSYATTYAFPLTINSTYAFLNPLFSPAFSVSASLSRSLDLSVSGPSVFPSGLQSFTPNTTALTLDTHASPDSYTTDTVHLHHFNTSILHTTQTGAATYYSSPSASSSSSGTTEQDFVFSGIALSGTVELYRRHVLAVNDSVREDEETVLGRGGASRPSTDVNVQLVPGVPLKGDGVGEELFSVRALLGRGPGRSKQVHSG
ncbi:hypothetical protein MMC16_002394 [Acarospora aff. strigata]|nr:hypothetical protein [Acarospora aff. strigata]